MIILFIDDQDYRHEIAEKNLGKDHTILHAFSCQEAFDIAKSCQNVIGLMMFDHDMGESMTGSDLASQMIETLPKEKYPARVIAHTNNVNGGLNIVSKWQSMDVEAEYRCWNLYLTKNLNQELVES